MGYHIPKGALVVSNLWYVRSVSFTVLSNEHLIVGRQMSHDPENYHDPFTFKPERFLEENGRKPELDPRTIAFGFGRRYE